MPDSSGIAPTANHNPKIAELGAETGREGAEIAEECATDASLDAW